MKAKETLNRAFIKMAATKSDATRETAYGALSANQISELFKLARNITWPILGLGNGARTISEINHGAGIGTTEKDNFGLDDVQRESR